MTPETPAIVGFSDVDRMPEPAMLVRVMDETSGWPATRRLREVAAGWIAGCEPTTVLDVGCGPGDAGIELARTLPEGGRVVGLDASEVMVEEANRRAREAGVAAEFHLGDAEALDFETDSFDAARSERTFQWLDRPEAALAELCRITRPGGRVVIVDTDWGTFAPYHPDPEATEQILGTIFGRRPGFRIGRRLPGLFADAGLVDIQVEAATHLSTEWDPAVRPAPPGLPPMRMILDPIVASGELARDQVEAWMDQLEQTARDDRFFASLTMFAVGGRLPA